MALNERYLGRDVPKDLDTQEIDANQAKKHSIKVQ
jgi:hypothetical protein